jgi:hypothetical protein
MSEGKPATEEKIIPLGEHNAAAHYPALNGEMWPTSVSSHLRLADGKLVHAGSHIQASIRNGINKRLNGFVDAFKEAFDSRDEQVNARYEESERKLDEAMRSCSLRIDEEIAEMRGYRDEVRAQLYSVHSKLAALQAENDLLRKALSPDKGISTDDAISMLRNVRHG